MVNEHPLRYPNQKKQKRQKIFRAFAARPERIHHASQISIPMHAEQSLLVWDDRAAERAQPIQRGCLLILVLVSALVVAIALLVLYEAVRLASSAEYVFAP